MNAIEPSKTYHVADVCVEGFRQWSDLHGAFGTIAAQITACLAQAIKDSEQSGRTISEVKIIYDNTPDRQRNPDGTIGTWSVFVDTNSK